MSIYSNLFDETSSAPVRKNNFWLVCVKSEFEDPITSGKLDDYEGYATLTSYKEEMQIVNRQIKGEKGVYSNNLLVCMPRNSTSVGIFNAFSGKNTLSSVEIVEVLSIDGKLCTRQKITYSKCKIENFENSMNEMKMLVNYSTRQDKFTEYTENGMKSGHVIGKTFK